ESVIAALGITTGDLFAEGNGAGTATRPKMKPKPSRIYPTPEAAEEALAVQFGTAYGPWYYRVAGRDRLAVLRFDTAEGKTYRPLHPTGDGWPIGDPPEPLPLYGFDELGDAKRVYVVEGEKCADVARAVGLIATTSAHGAKSPHKTDWRPLAGRDVVILPDNNEAGRGYADWIARHLLEFDPATKVRIVDLPDLPDGGDINDWIANQDGAEQLDEQIEAFAAAAPVVRLEAVGIVPPAVFQPIPVEQLPPLLREYVTLGAEAIVCDPSFIAVPLLTAAAAAIGNTRRIVVKQGWAEPAIVWSAIVADSGSAKSPALDRALQPMRDVERECFRRHEQAM
ncbi:MAG: DUF3987 domain-containing protein, partial [Pirellulales bacterium]